DHTYGSGRVVDISADADPGWEFVNWTGDVADPNAESTTVTLDGDKTVTANFTQLYTLTMAVNGSGTTTPVIGDHTYPAGTEVDISAIESVAGWDFVNWTGDVADPNAESTTVTVDGDKTVTANFTNSSYTLTMAVSGNGETDPAVGEHTYTAGTVVDISATALGDSHFVSWTGDVAEPNFVTTTVTVDGDKTVTARFSQKGGVSPAVRYLLLRPRQESESER
ncbi:MAG: hypothetical protein SWQ30_05880, partial [Thermodesulfobacteriota bacterium]|nr:hypothetical protein [Thermodesulfobacteriota bacterium]